MKMLNYKLLKQCCIELEHRRNNKGMWRNRQIPDCIYVAAQQLGLADDDDNTWLIAIEAFIGTRAVKEIAERED